MNSVVQRHRPGPATVSRTFEVLEESLRQVREALCAAVELTHSPGLVPDEGLDLHNATDTICAAEQVVTQRLTDHRTPFAEKSQLIDLLVHFTSFRNAISEARLSTRATAVTEINDALRQMCTASSVKQLVQLVPEATGRLGYNRTLLSRVQGENWLPQSAHAHADPSLAQSMIEVGRAAPGSLRRNAPEGSAFRHRVPVLVRDAQARPEVHPELKALIHTQAYVSAPLLVNGRVVGLLHADDNSRTGGIDELDRDMLGLFTEGLGFVFERTSCRERLTTLRWRLCDETSAAARAADGFTNPEATRPSIPQQNSGQRAATPSETPSRINPHGLTRRELEVMTRLAEGERNSQIAAQLFLSEGTVKTHVKNILRKLDAENRAQAVARYHALA